jgi:hypothetical protein
MMPHDLPGRGPWFEGWYVRVTDPARHLSFATIATSSTSSDEILWFTRDLPGYAAFLFQADGVARGKTRSVEVYPDVTSISTDESASENPHFCWSSPHIGSYCDQSLDMKFPSGDRVQVQFGQRMPWEAKNPDWGPAGLPTFIPQMPLLWYVDSLGTPVKYTVKLGQTGQVIHGSGFAHVEKNWGRVFPKAWVWLQATSPADDAHVALAGGPLQVGPASITSYLVGYKSKNADVNIHPDQGPQVSYQTEIDSCQGHFKLTAKNFEYSIVVDAKANPQSFAPVSIPTAEGYKPNQGKESFSAEISVTVYKLGRWLETRTFEGAALEFGASFMKCAAP